MTKEQLSKARALAVYHESVAAVLARLDELEREQKNLEDGMGRAWQSQNAMREDLWALRAEKGARIAALEEALGKALAHPWVINLPDDIDVREDAERVLTATPSGRAALEKAREKT